MAKQDPISFVHNLIGRKAETQDDGPIYAPPEDADEERHSRSTIRQTVTDGAVFGDGFHIERLPVAQTFISKPLPEGIESREDLAREVMRQKGAGEDFAILERYYFQHSTAPDIAARHGKSEVATTKMIQRFKRTYLSYRSDSTEEKQQMATSIRPLSTDQAELRNAVRRLRERIGASLDGAAAPLGVSASTLVDWENGEIEIAEDISKRYLNGILRLAAHRIAMRRLLNAYPTDIEVRKRVWDVIFQAEQQGAIHIECESPRKLATAHIEVLDGLRWVDIWACELAEDMSRILD